MDFNTSYKKRILKFHNLEKHNRVTFQFLQVKLLALSITAGSDGLLLTSRLESNYFTRCVFKYDT